MSALARVRAAIARAALGEADFKRAHLGAIVLHAHQRRAVRLIEAAIGEFSGALLADDPGLGKTYVALAVASQYRTPLVAAPAALAAMWREAAAKARVDVRFISLESLSRRAAATQEPDIVIVDEAQHASNPATARYRALAALTSGAATLLLSATPLRNRQREVDALLGLFLGARTNTLTDDARARCIVRRENAAVLRPRIVGPTWHRVGCQTDFAAAISSLPSAVLALDSAAAGKLIAMSLARCWSSSLAAFDRALTRRLQRGAALDDILLSGRVPTRQELQAWVVGDDAVQLAFPWCATHESADTTEWRSVLHAHVSAVRALRDRVRPRVARDAGQRGAFLRSVMAGPAARCCIAFTTFAATAESLYGVLRHDPGVALLTSRGARSASGWRPRQDVVEMLGVNRPATRAHPADSLRLVIATGVLSEGVNLQRADTIVHLDFPWTPSGLEQRVGRAARIGSPHESIVVLGLSPPRPAERLVAIGHRITAKRLAARQAVQAADDREALRRTLARWVDQAADERDGDAGVSAAASATRDGFLSVVCANGETRVVGGTRWRGGYVATESPAALRQLVESVSERPAPLQSRSCSLAHAAIARLFGRKSARDAAGLDGSATTARRIVINRLDSVLTLASASDRPRLAVTVATLRTMLHQASGSATERALHTLAHDHNATVADWLTSVERAITIRSRRNERAATADPPAVTALLLLVKEPSLCVGPAIAAGK